MPFYSTIVVCYQVHLLLLLLPVRGSCARNARMNMHASVLLDDRRCPPRANPVRNAFIELLPFEARCMVMLLVLLTLDFVANIKGGMHREFWMTKEIWLGSSTKLTKVPL